MSATIAAELAIDISTDASKAVSGFDGVENAAQGMESAVKSAGDTSEATARQVRLSADAADDLGGKAGKATGALGALSSGFELVGAEKYAGALQGASMATDFFSGVGDSLNLVMESTIVKTVRAKAASVGHAVATRAITVATRAQAVAQRVLNVAMRANPIGLVITAVLALVALFVLLYKKNEAFRTIVQTVARVASAYIRTIITVVSSLVTWVKTHAPAAFEVMKDKAVAIGKVVLAPFKAVRDMIESIVGWIKKIKLPDLGKLGKLVPGFGRMAFVDGPSWTGPDLPPGTPGDNPFGGGGGTTVHETHNYYISGAVDPNGTAQQIDQLHTRRSRRLGKRP